MKTRTLLCLDRYQGNQPSTPLLHNIQLDTVLDRASWGTISIDCGLSCVYRLALWLLNGLYLGLDQEVPPDLP